MIFFTLTMAFFISMSPLHGSDPQPHVYKSATTQHYSLYLQAQYSHQQNETELAQKYYAQLFTLKAPVFTYAGYFEHLYNLGHYYSIINLLAEIKHYFDDQKETQIIIGQSLELAGKKYEAENIFINLYTQYKNQADIAYYAAAAHTRRQAFTQALTIIDDYLDSSPQKPAHFMFYFLKSKIYQFLHNETKAVENLKKGLDLYKLIKGVVSASAIDTELPLVSHLATEAFYIFDTSLKCATTHKQQRKLVTLWKKLHS